MSPCFECGNDAMHEHHVVPRSIGGTQTVPLCEECHGKVHGRDMRTAALTKAALQAKRARGERAGTVPYGFTADASGRLSRCEAERAVVCAVQSLRSCGTPLRTIVAELAKKELASRTGKPFQLTQVARIARILDVDGSASSA